MIQCSSHFVLWTWSTIVWRTTGGACNMYFSLRLQTWISCSQGQSTFKSHTADFWSVQMENKSYLNTGVFYSKASALGIKTCDSKGYKEGYLKDNKTTPPHPYQSVCTAHRTSSFIKYAVFIRLFPLKFQINFISYLVADSVPPLTEADEYVCLQFPLKSAQRAGVNPKFK